jgi:hypothetical protein
VELLLVVAFGFDQILPRSPVLILLIDLFNLDFVHLGFFQFEQFQQKVCGHAEEADNNGQPPLLEGESVVFVDVEGCAGEGDQQDL